jgi:hypothetical protein
MATPAQHKLLQHLSQNNGAQDNTIYQIPEPQRSNFLEAEGRRDTGGMTLTPRRCSASRWLLVKGLSHMKVFMAGATRSGREKSQALTCSAWEARFSQAHSIHGMQDTPGVNPDRSLGVRLSERRNLASQQLM